MNIFIIQQKYYDSFSFAVFWNILLKSQWCWRWHQWCNSVVKESHINQVLHFIMIMRFWFKDRTWCAFLLQLSVWQMFFLVYQPCREEFHVVQWHYWKFAYPREHPRHWEGHPECRCLCPGNKLARDLHVDSDHHSCWFPVRNNPRTMYHVHDIQSIRCTGPLAHNCFRFISMPEHGVSQWDRTFYIHIFLCHAQL